VLRPAAKPGPGRQDGREVGCLKAETRVDGVESRQRWLERRHCPGAGIVVGTKKKRVRPVEIGYTGAMQANIVHAGRCRRALRARSGHSAGLVAGRMPERRPSGGADISQEKSIVQ